MIRSDLRSLRKTKSLYSILLVLAAFVLITAFSTWYMTEKSMTELLDFAQKQMAEEGMEQGGNMAQIGAAAQMLDAGDARVMQLQVRRQMSFSILATLTYTAPLAHTLTVVLMAIYASKDYATGYLKNLLGVQNIKTKWIISKVLMAALAIAVVVISMLLFGLLGTLILGNPMEFNFPQVLPFLSQHMLVSFALCMLTMMVLVLTQNKTTALTVGMLLSFNTQNLLYMLLDTTDWLPFRLRDWGMMNQAGKIALGGAMPEKLPLIAGTIILVSLLASLVSINKRDLKM